MAVGEWHNFWNKREDVVLLKRPKNKSSKERAMKRKSTSYVMTLKLKVNQLEWPESEQLALFLSCIKVERERERVSWWALETSGENNRFPFPFRCASEKAQTFTFRSFISIQPYPFPYLSLHK
jgi:hypothetical protein